MSKSGSPKKWFAIADENRRDGGMHASGLVWPLKWAVLVVRANRYIDKVLTDVHKKIGFFDVGIRITQKIVCYSTRKSAKRGICVFWGSIDLENGSYCSWWKTGCIDKVLTDVQKDFWHFDVEIQITQKMVLYSTRKSSKWGVYALQGSFDLEYGSDWPRGPTGCLSKILKSVYNRTEWP